MDIQIVAHSRCVCGEGPLWHPEHHCLYWVDIDLGRLLRYDPRTGEHRIVHQGRPVGGFTIQTDGSLLLFRDRGRIEVWDDGRIIRTLIEAIPGEENTRFNDVAADPQGRVFCGTMDADGVGRLYRLDPDATYRILFENVGCSNGIGFSPDRKQMYFAESLARTIWVFDYAETTGELSRKRAFARTTGDECPDGLTVDAAGDVWAAVWNGGCVVCYGPDGKLKDRIPLPARQITSLIFGGQDYGDLYITSAARNQGDDVNNAGDLFCVTPNLTGRPEFRSRIGL